MTVHFWPQAGSGRGVAREPKKPRCLRGFPEPEGFVVALLGEDRSEFLVYDRNGEAWVEYGDYAYRPCN